jgi:hypothetical protein
MGSRDHGYQCETCGYARGGLNDLMCECDAPKLDVDAVMARVAEIEIEQRLDCLARNLSIAAGLCEAFKQGTQWPYYMDHEDMADNYAWSEWGESWRPGCLRTVPGWEDS